MFQLSPDSECEIGSEVITSNQSSMSSEGSISIRRLSFDAIEISAKMASSSPECLSLKPHKSSDSAWEAIRAVAFRRKNGLSFKDFKLVRRIGSGDIGNVYLCSLKNENGMEESDFYAMKVVDKEALALKKKIERAEMEKKVLKMLDHPFLPTLYAEFESSHFSCVIMEFCSGGDLHNLRHKQPGKRFCLSSARFYAAEVLLALEYLHMLGIIYRDLKPENILVRSDGHIMLSDFDLSLKSDANPFLEPPVSSPETLVNRSSSSFSCFPTGFLRSRKNRIVSPNPQFIAEPVTAKSRSFVGTHEYVSPEVASGKSHGNAVDWWAFGIFFYELIYGRTPFAGENNEKTLRNIIEKPLVFPETSVTTLEASARELISGLLAKDPTKRLGSKRGAAEIKTHTFFKGLNFALIRSYSPPEMSGLRRTRTCPERKKPARIDYF